MINSHYCTECICHEDGTRHPSSNSIGTTDYGTTSKYEQCNIHIGDGLCDESNNIPQCDYDGG